MSKKGFTLAEMMVVLLIVSIVMAAFLPIMTKRSGLNNSPTLWKLGTNNADVVFNPGTMNGVSIGHSIVPFPGRLFLNMPAGYTKTDNSKSQLVFGIGGTAVAKIGADSNGFNFISTAGGLGSLFVNGTSVMALVSNMVMTGPSDKRLKNVQSEFKAGIKEIRQLKPYNYTFKADKEKKPHVGIIAQDLQKVFPKSVFKAEDGYLHVSKDEMFYGMMNSIKELDKKVTTLEAENRALKTRLSKLEADD